MTVTVYVLLRPSVDPKLKLTIAGEDYICGAISLYLILLYSAMET